jgi:hypothetical protein
MPATINGTSGFGGNLTGNVTGNADTATFATSSLTLATAQATTSGTSIDFTGIPSWVKRITVMLNEVSTIGTANYLLQIGDSGGIETSGYTSNTVTNDSAGNANGATFSSGFVWYSNSASYAQIGLWTLVNVSGNTWIATHTAYLQGTNIVSGGGVKALSGTLDRVRLTTVNGTDTFDAGSVNISYEG